MTLGILPAWGGTQRFPRLVGLQAALDIISLGNPISAEKAFQLGSVDKVCIYNLFVIANSL